MEMLERALQGCVLTASLCAPVSGAESIKIDLPMILSGAGAQFGAHDNDVSTRIADRIAVMDKGLLIATGTPDKIRPHPDVRRVYLGYDETPVKADPRTVHA